MATLEDPSRKQRRTMGAESSDVRVAVHKADCPSCPSLLFADGTLLEEEVVKRSELLHGILQVEGETVIPVSRRDFNAWREYQPSVHLPGQRLVDLLQVTS